MVQYLRATAYPRTRSFSLFFRMLKISAYDRKELKRSSILEFFSFSVQRPADKSLNRRETRYAASSPSSLNDDSKYRFSFTVPFLLFLRSDVTSSWYISPSMVAVNRTPFYGFPFTIRFCPNVLPASPSVLPFSTRSKISRRSNLLIPRFLSFFYLSLVTNRGVKRKEKEEKRRKKEENKAEKRFPLSRRESLYFNFLSFSSLFFFLYRHASVGAQVVREPLRAS